MLILASGSHVRHRLLKQVGIKHKVVVSGFDEGSFHDDEPRKLVKDLSIAKVKAVDKKIFCGEEGSLAALEYSAILGCDSVFEFQGELFGKPRDESEAIDRLQRMSSNSGLLHTGHTLVFRDATKKSNRDEVFNMSITSVITTRVQFCKLNKKEIKEYVLTGEPLSSAGCFNLEGRGAFYIESIDGCYTNVMGLSLPWLRVVMQKIN